MAKAIKFRASKLEYVPSNQLTIEGFSTNFHADLDLNNRWVKMSSKIPWDALVSVYNMGLKNKKTGAKGINPRVVLAAMIIKHINGWSDRETVLQIQENVYLQFFLGFSKFVTEPIFDASTFVDFRKRLNLEAFEKLNTVIAKVGLRHIEFNQKGENTEKKSHYGKLLVDATAFPQDITYPTDLKLLNSALCKSQDLIDLLYDKKLHKIKPRTDRKKYRKIFLKVAQARQPKKSAIRNALKQQLTALAKNIKSIHTLLDSYSSIPSFIKKNDYKYLLVIQTVYWQQKQMYDQQTKTIEYRIVNIHQPHIRPIVRGKLKAKVEFGSKINLSLVAGYNFLDEFSWEAFNEGQYLKESVEKYKKRHGFYPEKVLVDKIYSTRENRKWLQSLDIKLQAKPLGRPKAGDNPVSPGERNAIEGLFGQAKGKYRLDRVMARLDITSKSWIACTLLVLNLIKLVGASTLLTLVYGKKSKNLINFRPLIPQITHTQVA